MNNNWKPEVVEDNNISCELLLNKTVEKMKQKNYHMYVDNFISPMNELQFI